MWIYTWIYKYSMYLKLIVHPDIFTNLFFTPQFLFVLSPYIFTSFINFLKLFLAVNQNDQFLFYSLLYAFVGVRVCACMCMCAFLYMYRYTYFYICTLNVITSAIVAYQISASKCS